MAYHVTVSKFLFGLFLPRSPVSRLQPIPKSRWSESFAKRCQRSQSQSRSQRPQDLFVWSLLKAPVKKKMERMKSVLKTKKSVLNKTPIFLSCTAWKARHRLVNALGMCGFKRHGHGHSWKRSWILRIFVAKMATFVWTSMSSCWKSWSKKRRQHVPLRAKRALTTRRIRKIVWTNTSKKLNEDVRWSKAASVVSSSQWEIGRNSPKVGHVGQSRRELLQSTATALNVRTTTTIYQWIPWTGWTSWCNECSESELRDKKKRWRLCWSACFDMLFDLGNYW